ncbi:MAG TPA: hypothetical protein VM576_12100 [Xanthomonadaceae bacterium]|nr:hypothetical protein [Xanthomonadaceae bacterium]
MLFDVIGLTDEATARSIAFAVHALDPQAKLTVNLGRGRLLVEGRLQENEIRRPARRRLPGHARAGTRGRHDLLRQLRLKGTEESRTQTRGFVRGAAP